MERKLDNLKDYILWLGEFDYSAKPFCEVDAVLLCLISYFDLELVLQAQKAKAIRAAKAAARRAAKKAAEQAGQASGGKAGKDSATGLTGKRTRSSAVPAQPIEIKEPEGFFIRDCLPMAEKGTISVCITGGEQGFTEILKAAAQSKRFGNLWVSNCVDRIEPENDLQFSAVTFSWENDFSFIAYRGTDNTLVGWKEDFMIAYTRTEAQKLALQYAQDAIGAAPKAIPQKPRKTKLFGKQPETSCTQKRWYIGGHSKGANLALYTGAYLNDEQMSQVERVFILDGPGFAPEVLDLKLIKRLDPKATRIIPEHSIIGRIMEPQITDLRVIESSNSGVMEHSISSWLVDHGKMAAADDPHPSDMWINDTISEWIDKMSLSDRICFVSELFDALMSGGAETIEDLSKGGLAGIDQVIRSFKGFSDTTRKILGELQQAAMGNAVKRIKDVPADALDTAVNTVKPFFKSAMDFIIEKGKGVIGGIL